MSKPRSGSAPAGRAAMTRSMSVNGSKPRSLRASCNSSWFLSASRALASMFFLNNSDSTICLTLTETTISVSSGRYLSTSPARTGTTAHITPIALNQTAWRRLIDTRSFRRKSTHTSDEAFQVMRFQARRRNGMVSGRPPALQNLYIALFLGGQLPQQFLQHIHRDKAGATTSHKKAFGFQHAHRRSLQAPVAAQRFFHGPPITGELRRIEYHHAKPGPAPRQRVQFVEYIAFDSFNVIQSIKDGILSRQCQSRL